MAKKKMKILDGVPVFGEPQEDAVTQIKNCLKHKSAARAALMADHHVGYAVPIGGVVAYHEAISPSGVGFDIACGNKAVRLDVPADEVRSHIQQIMDDIFANISFGLGRANKERVDHELFDDPAWKLEPVRPLKEMAYEQLGTVGAGNHYVDVFVDELDRVWVGVHFGSRGLGHRTLTWFLKKTGVKDGMMVDPLVLSTREELGQTYLECMRLAGRYAYAGRDWVCSKVAQLIGANIVEEIHNHHNFAWKEVVDGVEMWVVRKGATPAYPGQKSFVGGTMGEPAVILEGVEPEKVDTFGDKPLSHYTLFSTVHGAGRVLGRRQAKKKLSRASMEAWLRREGIFLRGGDVDESPECYKRLSEVLRAQGNTVRILHTLKPLGVAMAGRGVVDPYKD